MRPLNLVTLVTGLALAGIGSDSHAVALSTTGHGQVVIVPYYTTRAGNDTLFLLTNNSDTGRAVKLRLLESQVGRPVQDINIYLSPHDTWTAAIVDGAAWQLDGAALLINDDSCLAIDDEDAGNRIVLDDGRAVLPLRVPEELDIADYRGPVGADRNRSGSIEIIEMAHIDPDGEVASWLQPVNGQPRDCGAVTDAWQTDGPWPNDVYPSEAGYGLLPPDGVGDLSATVMIVNSARGSLFEVPVDAITGFNHHLVLHTPPWSFKPTLDDVHDYEDLTTATAVVIDQTGRVLTSTYEDPFYGEGRPRKFNAISALFAATRISNDYFLTSTDSVRAHSEWVFHYPALRRRPHHLSPARHRPARTTGSLR